MAVDTNFASLLLDKVKVEDPWLPPTTWESIPSQSGPLSPTLPPPLLSDTCSVSESSLVRLALNALQGVQSSLISIEKLASAFSSDPADRTFHRIPNLWNRSSSTFALANILKSLGSSGLLVFLLFKFVDYFRAFNLDEHTELSQEKTDQDNGVKERDRLPYSLVNQAFAVAVGKVLQGYICALNTLYGSIGLRRRSSKSFDVPSEVGCLTSILHSEITLLEVYLHTKDLRTQIEALGNLCNLHDLAQCFSESSFEDLAAKSTTEFHKFCRGGDLLTYLYTQLQVADPTHRSLLKFLFTRSCEPYCGFIRSWIFKAEINDPYEEFIIEYADNLPPNTHGKAGTSINFLLAKMRERNGVSIPCFLKHFLIPLVRAGQQLQVLMKLLELCNCVFSADHTYIDFLPCWSGFSSNHLFSASPITFKKENIEAMVIARNSYYEKMQEKLDNFLTKLEFNYQQVVLDSPEASFFENGGSEFVSFELKDRMIDPSVADDTNVAVGGKDFDDSSMNDEFSYAVDTSESSESSSLSGNEEHPEPEQLIEHPNSLLELEQKYFSALTFTVCTPTNNSLQKTPRSEKSYHIESDPQESCERADALVQFKHSQQRGMVFSSIDVQPESEESRLSCGDVRYTDGLLDNSWPLGSLLKNPFYVGGYRSGQELHPSDSGLKVSEANMGAFREIISYNNKTVGSNSPLMKWMSGEDQPVNSYATSRFLMMQKSKLNYNNNIFSTNPMLTKNAFFHLMSKPGERWNADHRQSLPSFDFSSVEDPFKVSLEKLAAGSTEELLGDSNVSAVSVGMTHQSEQGHGSDNNPIDNCKVSYAYPPLDLKDHNRDVASTNVSGRSSWESSLFLSNNIDDDSVGDLTQNFLAVFEIPLEFIIDKCLLQEILLQYNYVSKLTIKLLEEGFDLHGHLMALRRYHFMELADWADLFIMSLWRHKWCVTEADHRVSEIQGFLELSVQRSSCERDHYKDRLFVYMKGHETLPLLTSVTGVRSFDFLGLGYRVDWPVSIVLTPRALKIYADIFSFLIQLKLAVFSVNDVWCSLKDLMHSINQNRHSTQYKREVGHFNLLVKLRHQVNHFVSTLQQYVQSQLSHVSWCRFLHSIKHKVKDMMDLESVHMAYLTDSLDICFLSDEARFVTGIIESILQCALDFRSCLTRGIWDIELDQGDLMEKLSRINISQVHAIKQKFDKSLKELHLCYLKSPKHGEFGLSRFWDYLNYNEYYSDVGNEVGRYAYSV
ncbi:hypothetical protein Q3G72_004193 [Acer saccharum]|nr:hypothetical protein Q3G72_004193 [Acer saccharum]